MTETLARPKLTGMPLEIEESSEKTLAKGVVVNPRRCAFLVFLFFSFFYLMTSSGRIRTMDEYMTFFETENLVLHQSASVPQALQLNYFYGKYGTHGEPRSPYSPGQPIFATPWYAAGHFLFLHLPGVPAQASSLVLAASACFSSSFAAGAAVAFLFLIAIRLGLSLRQCFLTAAIVGFATPVFAYSSWFYSEPLTSALLVAAAYFVFARHLGELVPVRSAMVGGALIGCAVFIRPVHVPVAVVFFIAILLRDRSKGFTSAVTLASISAMGLGALLLYNFHCFGNFLDFGYPAIAEGNKRLNDFSAPIHASLYGFLLSPGKSVFLFAPPMLLALFGVPKLWRKDRGLAAVGVGAFLAYLAFFARYTQWEGGYSVGPRYMVPALLLLCIALAPIIGALNLRTRIAAIVLTVFGFLVQIVSMATSFMESQVPPGVYYDSNWNYVLHYSLWSQVQVLLHHLSDPTPARLGLGWDRWFVFLAKGGVSHATLSAIFCVMLLGAIVSGLSLRKTLINSA